MVKSESLSRWQLPKGVPAGAWSYSQKDAIADEYDEYFADHPLFSLDATLLDRWLPSPGESPVTIADLGCGTGRALLPLVRRGFRGLAIDLSARMLDIVQAKAQRAGLSLVCVRANLVELDGLCDHSVDHAICLFSTLGMINGRKHRRAMLKHTRRILKPGGRLIVHVHNTWSVLYDPAGPWWLLRNGWHSIRGRAEFGDRIYLYRGLPNMFLHNYRYRELHADLVSAGFRVQQALPLCRDTSAVLNYPWLFPAFRAGGYIVSSH